jgi:hypothetical protein
LYPDVVTLAPAMTAAAVLAGIAERPDCAVKDSFADVELGPRGFAVVLEARWLFREAAGAGRRPRLGWMEVADRDDAADWIGAAGLEGVLLPELVDDPAVRLLRAGGDGWVAGAVVHASEGVADLSNVFLRGIEAGPVWADLPAAIGQILGGVPIVGYEDGEALRTAQAHGFAPVGALRVWARAS